MAGLILALCRRRRGSRQRETRSETEGRMDVNLGEEANQGPSIIPLCACFVCLQRTREALCVGSGAETETSRERLKGWNGVRAQRSRFLQGFSFAVVRATPPGLNHG
ncbi:hypothetical protein Q7C36_015796 [Tachysurus vachellii]|uniref:Uncharacterized protein n=1 Tax=Tachysurus vachellii TaxID=175792 RepID=A0AA88M9Z3_TACVA|nr:hypothetical protein Q7C36_015796 [Tachysurus vachellii]